ncbi:hypothetical protein EP331_05105 [bacterium]|nr:MAG: hypothetical protein EP331_05105 [bacterium]
MAAFQEKFFYLCQIPLSAEGATDVQVITHAEDSNDFPRVFQEYEGRRKHAFNEEDLYSVIRADEINLIVRTTTPEAAKVQAFEEATPELITNLQHRVMQSKDKNAQSILKDVHGIEVEIK